MLQSGHQWRSRAFAAVFFAAAVTASPAVACGYENPSDLALGMLNWVYPDALHVQSAVWQAEEVGLLPPRSTSLSKDLFGAGFRRAAKSVTAVGKGIDGSVGAKGHRPSFSVVLIPAVMWTTYAPGDGGYAVTVHADGPAKGDVVIVTDEKVIRALADGSLAAATAERHGLIRLYGAADRQDQVRAVLSGLKAETSETLGDHARLQKPSREPAE